MELEDVPAEIRWEIATKAALVSGIGYNMAFREILGDETVDQIEEAIDTEAGKEIKTIADSLGFPTTNAIEVDDAYGIVGMIIMGKMEYETLEATNERVVQRVTNCPILNTNKEMNAPFESMPNHCQAFGKSAVEELNPKYTHRFSKQMCAGDEYCQYTIE